ncbi:MAG TPA: class I SAM-dependent methyltransferase [Bauldia sp.]|nr:class I SAM-dependent methyltransferase [Bauldia sp.]
MERQDGNLSSYILGHSPTEMARLERQGHLFADLTETVLRRAGVARGMEVLDVGCGVGDVSLIAARLVGDAGMVTGVDQSEHALGLATRRAAAAGHDRIRFETGDITRLDNATKFDAIVGRFVLLHVPDAAAVLRRLRALLRPNGVIAFLEMDIERAEAVPEMPLLTQCISWIAQTYRKDGIEPNMGSKLYAAFRHADLTPTMMGTCRIERPPAREIFEFAAETLRSLLPRTLALGVATAEAVEIDSLGERLSSSAVTGDHCIFLPRLVGAWCRI